MIDIILLGTLVQVVQCDNNIFHCPFDTCETRAVVCASQCLEFDCNGFLVSNDKHCSYIGRFESPTHYISDDYHECEGWQKNIYGKDGVYTIITNGSSPFLAPCDLHAGGWTIIQRRIDDTTDFFRGWADYVAGFGDFEGNFWLGLDHIHALTKSGKAQLQVVMETFEGEKFVANYEVFEVGNASTGYQLYCTGYSGNSGDSLCGHSGMKFTTKDNDQDTNSNNCAVYYNGAWWFSSCHGSHLNGQYRYGQHSSYAQGIIWRSAKGYYYSMKSVEMKIRNT